VCCGVLQYSSVVQCVAVCCSVLRCVAVGCSGLQCAVVCCSVLNCASVCCSVLQRVAVCCSVLGSALQCVAVCCNTLSCIAGANWGDTPKVKILKSLLVEFCTVHKDHRADVWEFFLDCKSGHNARYVSCTTPAIRNFSKVCTLYIYCTKVQIVESLLAKFCTMHKDGRVDVWEHFGVQIGALPQVCV